MRTGSCPSSAYYPPRHHRRFTVAWCCIIVLVAISTVDIVSAKDSLNSLPFPASYQASPNTMITQRQRRSAQVKHSGGRSAPLMVARGGNNDDVDAAAANKSTDNMKHPISTDASLAAATTATTPTTTHTNTNWKAKLRNVVFPIYGEELTKFLLIGSIKFFVILALTITRDNKDTMVVTECGAEAIAFLKVSSLFSGLPHCSTVSLPNIVRQIILHPSNTSLRRSTEFCQQQPYSLVYIPRWQAFSTRNPCSMQHAFPSLHFSSSLMQ